MEAQDGIVVFLLLISLGLCGSLWNKQSQLVSELDHLQIKLQVQSEVQNELKRMFQVAISDRAQFQASERSRVKGKLKRNVRQADGETDVLSATEILTNALTEIIEMKLISYMDCNRNEYNYTKCTLKPGPKGEPGDTGPSGMQGGTGQRGPRGAKGDTGLLGPQGPTGEKGTKGEIGDMGQRGEPGGKGMKGNVGYPGYKGEKGKEGVDGPQGPPGPTGPLGPPGVQGKDGQKGEQGLAGSKGDLGLSGPQGAAGEKGGKGVIGERGLKGDIGPPGLKGGTGEKGDMGQSGEPGSKGTKGNAGYRGYKGEKGIAGPQGPRGPTGPQGLPGPTGPQGPPGQSGPPGLPSPTAPPDTTTQPPTGYSCSGSTGWRRVAYLNMSNSSQECPSVWQEITSPHRVCGRTASNDVCQGLTYTTGSEQYNQVCGRIIGYQIGIPNAFNVNSRNIDTNYVNGISVTRGSPRQHIWTFAAGVDEQIGIHKCPCITGNTHSVTIPSFVDQNYFCESGLTQYSRGSDIFWPNGDPLWDGQGCGPTSTCCTFNSPPWFNIQLSLPTTDDIEVRICDNVGIQTSDSPIQLMELYVK